MPRWISLIIFLAVLTLGGLAWLVLVAEFNAPASERYPLALARMRVEATIGMKQSFSYLKAAKEEGLEIHTPSDIQNAPDIDSSKKISKISLQHFNWMYYRHEDYSWEWIDRSGNPILAVTVRGTRKVYDEPPSRSLYIELDWEGNIIKTEFLP